MIFADREITWLYASARRSMYASFQEYVNKYKITDVDLFFEGDKPEPYKSPKRIEVRVDGPYPERSIGFARIEINLLVNTTLDKHQVYAHQHIVSLAVHMFKLCIPVLQLGYEDTPENPVHVKNLTLDAQTLAVSNHGLVDPTVSVYQSSVEGHYTFETTQELVWQGSI